MKTTSKEYSCTLVKEETISAAICGDDEIDIAVGDLREGAETIFLTLGDTEAFALELIDLVAALRMKKLREKK